jgi:4-hydroxy-3-methylbut-2-enyl diphosphate reductase
LSDNVDAVVVIGSQNSSNSQRLKELGLESGRKAYLIDGPDSLDPNDFAASDTVLVTAGASAPESVVQETVTFLVDHFDATVEVKQVREESVHFPLPRALRVLNH